jgi:peptidoglycan hydrolase CwlO-like protein
MSGGEGVVERYQLQCELWRRDDSDEWVLEVTGEIGDTWLNSRHTEPLSTAAADAAGLPSLYSALEAAQSHIAELEDQVSEMEYRAIGNAEAGQFQVELLSQVVEQRDEAQSRIAQLKKELAACMETMERFQGVADKLIAEARRARAEALEEAAKVADAEGDYWITSHIARAIRALKETSNA